MGSEMSAHRRDDRLLDIQQRSPVPIHTTDFWTQFDAELLHNIDAESAQPAAQSSTASSQPDPDPDPIRSGVTPVSLFRGESTVAGQLWIVATPLERAARNLMVYRHPNILKYHKHTVGGKHQTLITERCQPLIGHPVLRSGTAVELRLGLQQIAAALQFLCERAQARHLNVGRPSVCVTPGGDWRLAGFQYVCKRTECTRELIELTAPFRCRPAMDCDNALAVNLEQFGYGEMCEQLLNDRLDVDDAHGRDFLRYCQQELQHRQPERRPSFSAVLEHPYFAHDFLAVHGFLTALPVKTASEKLQFFQRLPDRLRHFGASCVAERLGDLLLSRLVLLDPTAQLSVVPALLRVRSASCPRPLFDGETFARFMGPRVVRLFGVRETQTRLVLLEHFRHYARYVDAVRMRTAVLPELLAGIRDANDVLVAATLRALADLVPLLGASVVVGPDRVQLFADGRPGGQLGGDGEPLLHTGDLSAVAWPEHRSITPVLNAADSRRSSAGLAVADLSDATTALGVPRMAGEERLSPDGGEDETSDAPDAEPVEGPAVGWSDWEADEDEAEEKLVAAAGRLGGANESPEIDYFADMEPVIERTNVLLVDADANRSEQVRTSETMAKMLAVHGTDGVDADASGWGDDVDDWCETASN